MTTTVVLPTGRMTSFDHQSNTGENMDGANTRSTEPGYCVIKHDGTQIHPSRIDDYWAVT